MPRKQCPHMLDGDVFGRLLIAQGHMGHLRLITVDNRISQYGNPIGSDILFL